MNTLKKNSEFYSKLFSLVLPIAFQQFMLAAVNASDALMLGLLDQDSLSAVSLAGQVQFVFNLFLAAMAIGASMLPLSTGERVTGMRWNGFWLWC